MDLMENSQIRTSLNQCSESSFSFFFQLYFSLFLLPNALSPYCAFGITGLHVKRSNVHLVIL